MEKENNNKGIIPFLIVIIVMLLVVITLLVTTIIKVKGNESNVSQIKSFIVTDNFISTSNSVAENMPDGYVFLDNGKFAYHNYNFYRRFVEDEKNRLISFIGTWSINDNKLILKVEKEEYAVGGENVINQYVGNYLTNYAKKIENTNKTIKYSINGIDKKSDYMPYLSLTLNGNEVKWYSLPGIGDYLNIPRALAQNGYNEKYSQLTK